MEGNNEADRDQGQITKSDRHDQDDRNIGSDGRYGDPIRIKRIDRLGGINVATQLRTI